MWIVIFLGYTTGYRLQAAGLFLAVFALNSLAVRDGLGLLAWSDSGSRQVADVRLKRDRVAFDMRPLVTTSQVTSLVTTKTPTFDGEQSTGEQ